MIHRLDIVKLLKTEREKRFLTYADVAEAIGCSASYIFRLEKGKRKKPSYEIVSKIIDFFGLTEKDLMEYVDGDIQFDMDLESEILNYIRNMDTQNLKQVEKLIEMIQIYQK